MFGSARTAQHEIDDLRKLGSAARGVTKVRPVRVRYFLGIVHKRLRPPARYGDYRSVAVTWIRRAAHRQHRRVLRDGAWRLGVDPGMVADRSAAILEPLAALAALRMRLAAASSQLLTAGSLVEHLLEKAHQSMLD